MNLEIPPLPGDVLLFTHVAPPMTRGGSGGTGRRGTQATRQLTPRVITFGETESERDLEVRDCDLTVVPNLILLGQKREHHRPRIAPRYT